MLQSFDNTGVFDATQQQSKHRYLFGNIPGRPQGQCGVPENGVYQGDSVGAARCDPSKAGTQKRGNSAGFLIRNQYRTAAIPGCKATEQKCFRLCRHGRIGSKKRIYPAIYPFWGKRPWNRRRLKMKKDAGTSVHPHPFRNLASVGERRLTWQRPGTADPYRRAVRC